LSIYKTWQISWASQKIKRQKKHWFRDILAEMENKDKCYQCLSLNNFPKIKIVLVKRGSDQ